MVEIFALGRSAEGLLREISQSPVWIFPAWLPIPPPTRALVESERAEGCAALLQPRPQLWLLGYLGLTTAPHSVVLLRMSVSVQDSRIGSMSKPRLGNSKISKAHFASWSHMFTDAKILYPG